MNLPLLGSLKNVTPKQLSRFEKLRNHFRDTHKVASDLDFSEFRCNQEPCFLSESCGGVFFASQVDLEEHNRQCHVPSPSGEDGSKSRHFFTGKEFSRIAKGVRRPLAL